MIYFLQEGDSGPIKSGFSTGMGVFAARFSSLQQGNPKVLRCIGIVDGTEIDEQRLHQQFAEHHIRGEWFQPIEPLLTHILRHTQKYPNKPTPYRRKWDLAKEKHQ